MAGHSAAALRNSIEFQLKIKAKSAHRLWICDVILRKIFKAIQQTK